MDLFNRVKPFVRAAKGSAQLLCELDDAIQSIEVHKALDLESEMEIADLRKENKAFADVVENYQLIVEDYELEKKELKQALLASIEYRQLLAKKYGVTDAN